jgi:hypothetical protein
MAKSKDSRSDDKLESSKAGSGSTKDRPAATNRSASTTDRIKDGKDDRDDRGKGRGGHESGRHDDDDEHGGGDHGHHDDDDKPTKRILHIEKDATVPGGTANVAGETISYTLAVTNKSQRDNDHDRCDDDDDHGKHRGHQSNAAIANVVVDDPFTTNEAPVLVGGFNVGDLDKDNKLDVNETWLYTASHVVTQAELDAGANIVNTATVTGKGAISDSDDASVAVVQAPALNITKTVTDVGEGGPGGSVDAVGDVITYAITVANTGNQTLTGGG